MTTVVFSILYWMSNNNFFHVCVKRTKTDKAQVTQAHSQTLTHTHKHKKESRKTAQAAFLNSFTAFSSTKATEDEPEDAKRGDRRANYVTGAPI